MASRKKPSAAQLRARAKFSRIMKSGGFKKRKSSTKKLKRKTTKRRSTTVSRSQLTRSKSRFPTARSAWIDIGEKTGIEPSQVRANHTSKTWIWLLKKRSVTRRKPTRRRLSPRTISRGTSDAKKMKIVNSVIRLKLSRTKKLSILRTLDKVI